MKTIVKGAIRDEKGYVLTLVLILLVLGGLIIGPLLGLMSTGLIAGRVYENKMYEYYAADAGIEHGLWRLLNEEVDNINWPLIYELPGLVNNKEVRVAIEPAWLLEGLPDSLNLPDYQPSQDDPRYGNDHWTVTGSINIENTANYIIDITSDETNAGDINVGHIGVWLPPGYDYIEGSTEINGVGVGENETVIDPDPLEGILHKDGTVLIWHFEGVTFKTLSDISQPAEGGCTPAEKFPPSVRLSFDYETGSNYVELVYDASGIFTPPEGVTNVTVEAWGGGGGGGGRSGSGSGSGGAGGGGGGAYAEGTVSVTPGTTYTVTVGAGGAGGLAGNNPGTAGGDSSFVSQSTVLAKGGAGGGGGTGGTGGAGGSAGASIGSVKYSGGNGAAGRSSGDYRSGGGGGGAGDAAAGGDASGATGGAGGIAGGGDGADGLTSNGPGGNGTAPGGGGSGARRTSGGARAGGAGGSGKILVCYWTEEPTIAKGFFSWILLGDSRIAWDSQAGIFHIVSQAASDLDLGVQAGTTVETYTARSFRRYSPGTGGATSALRGDYIAIGNSLMTSCWKTQTLLGPPCDYICPHDIRGLYHSESSVTIDDNAVPSDARIQKAYLYWTAYLRDSNQPDVDVTLKVDDVPVSPGGTVEASKSYVVDVPRVEGWQYSCFADVTSQVKAITTNVNGVTFTVGGVSATPAEKADCGYFWCDAPGWNQYANAGWSMIIIYSSQEKETHQIYLYHDRPLTLQYANVEFSVTGFEAPELEEGGDMDAQLAVLVAEGDPHYYPDYLKFKGPQSADFYSLGDPGTSDLNPYNNVFNGYSTATGFVPSSLLGQAPGTISGVDIDVYTEDRYGTSLSDIVKPGDTSATVRLETNTDYIMLVYVVFSVRSTVALGEGFDVGTMTYKIG